MNTDHDLLPPKHAKLEQEGVGDRVEIYQCSAARRGDDRLAPAATTFLTAADFFPFLETGFSSSSAAYIQDIK